MQIWTMKQDTCLLDLKEHSKVWQSFIILLFPACPWIWVANVQILFFRRYTLLDGVPPGLEPITQISNWCWQGVYSESPLLSDCLERDRDSFLLYSFLILAYFLTNLFSLQCVLWLNHKAVGRRNWTSSAQLRWPQVNENLEPSNDVIRWY